MDFYDRVLQQRPDYPDIHARLGVIFCHLQRHQESIDTLKRAFRMKPRLKEESCYGVTFAISLAYLGKTEDALEAYRAAVKQNPKDARRWPAWGGPCLNWESMRTLNPRCVPQSSWNPRMEDPTSTCHSFWLDWENTTSHS
jgi:tetratricopeptide (TPR) repeat protein